MREGYIMERSRLKFRYIGILPVIFAVYLFTPSSQASQLRVALSALDSSMVTEHIQSGLQSELTRQGYVAGSNLTWINNQTKLTLSDINVTISASSSENTPFITLVNQQGLLTEISRDAIHRNTELAEHYKVNFIKKLLPGINTIGVIIDKNIDDMSNAEQFLAQQQEKGMQIVYYYIETSDELRVATRSLAPNVDVIYLPFHITDMPELEQVITVAERNNVALIGEDHRSINKGILAVYNIDYFQVGRDTADLLVRLAEDRDALNGSSNDNHNHYVAQPVLSLNLDAAARMGVELSNEVIDKAKVIIE